MACFHGRFNDSLQACLCDEGFIFDHSVYHDDICTMPVGAYEVNLILGSCFVAVLSPFMAHTIMVTHGNNRVIALTALLLCISYWLACFGLFLDQGWKRLTSISVLFFVLDIEIYVSKLMTIMFTHSMRVANTSQNKARFALLKTRQRALFSFFGVVLAIDLSANAVLVDSSQFNLTVEVLTIVIIGFATSIGILAISSTSELESGLSHAIEASPRDMHEFTSILTEFKRRLVLIRRIVMASVLSVDAMCLAFVVVHFLLSYVPYCWAALFPLLIMLLVSVCSATLLLVRKRFGSSAGKVDTSNKKSPVPGYGINNNSPGAPRPSGLSRFAKPDPVVVSGQGGKDTTMASEAEHSVAVVTTIDDGTLEVRSSPSSGFYGRWFSQGKSATSPSRLGHRNAKSVAQTHMTVASTINEDVEVEPDL